MPAEFGRLRIEITRGLTRIGFVLTDALEGALTMSEGSIEVARDSARDGHALGGARTPYLAVAQFL